MNSKAQTSNTRRESGATLRLAFGRMQTMFLTIALLAVLGMVTTLRADRVNHDVSAANLKVDRPGAADDNSNCVVTVSVTVNDVRTNVYDRGDYRLQIGGIADDDLTNGVLIASVAQNNRNNYGTNATQTTGGAPDVNGTWKVVTFISPFTTSETANRGEDNVNVGVGWFPFNSWIGGVALNSVNGGVLSNFFGSPGLVWGTHFIDARATNGPAGVAYLDLRSFGIDSRRDGVLLVNHPKDEANYALSFINNADDEMDGTWTLYCHDNRNNGRNYEQDPLSFVFVPKSNTNVVSGMFMGDGSIGIYSGTTPAFTVAWRTDIAAGTYELKIPGRLPTDGVLIVSHAGGDANNGDNIVTSQPNTAGDGWIIQSRDIPNLGLQSLPENEPVCSFVFIPAEKPGVTVVPNQNLITTETNGTAQFTVTVNGYPKPTANVTINLSSSDTSEGDVSPTSLTFTPSEWNVPKPVTVTGADDLIVDGTVPYSILLTPTTSTDPNFNGLPSGSVGVINIDNEAGISVSASSIITTESGGSNTFNVWLNTAPTDDVTLTLSSSDTTEATVSPASLTFTPANYATPQPVTATGVDDLVQDGNSSYFVITAAATSTDPAYNNFNALDVTGTNIDNDLARVIIPPDKLTVTESNTTASFAVVLGSEPTANVTVNFSSSDSTEGTVIPSVTFTPLNWSNSQNVTVTAADDLVNDGTVDFSIITTVTSTDPIYAAINPDDVAVETVDNEADFRLPSAPFTYGIGEGAKGIDGYATINDSDTADYGGGSLVVSITAGGTTSDRLDVRNTGTGPGQIGVSGSTVSYEGTTIGTKSGGTGLTALSISLNSSATPVAAQALARSVTYQNVDTNAAPQTRSVSYALSDGHGGVNTALTSIIIRLMRIDSYQQEADGGFGLYTFALDSQIHHSFPDTSYPAGFSANGLWIDFDTASLIPTDQMQCFVKFTNLIGNASGQIPPGAKIVFAELIMNVTDSGHGARFNRMLGDWDESTTFNNSTNGIQLDDIEAVSGTNAFLGDQAANTTSGTGLRKIGVTTDVQAWANGSNNFGWVMSTWTNGANGTAFSPCEATNITLRPRLRVGWIPATSTSVATFQQGENGYTNTVDTQVRLVAPTTSFAANATLSPDWLVNATPVPNQNDVLIRFDNIIGSGPGQIPAGSKIHAAILELTSINADAQGAGGQFHAVRKSWNATDTWDTWVNGVDTDGIEAAVSPTATLPVNGQGETVQPTRHNIELTADLQAWANGTANYGWAVMPWPNGNNGWAFNSSEGSSVTAENTHPKLRVFFSPGAPPVVIQTISRGPTSATIQLTGPASTGFTVLRSGTVTGTYTSIGTGTTQPDGTASFTDNSPLPNAAFYKISVP
jgi:hypothetical protein